MTVPAVASAWHCQASGVRPRVLFLASPVYDYLTDAVFHGLVNVLGKEHVLDYPRQQRYHVRTGGTDEATKYPMLSFADDGPAASHTEPNFSRDFDLVVVGRLHNTSLPALVKVLSAVERERIVYLDGMDDPFMRIGMWNKVALYFKRELLTPEWSNLWYAASKLGLGMRQNLRWLRDWLQAPPANPGLHYALSAPVKLRKRVQPLPFGLIDVGYQPPAAEKQYDVAFIGTLTSVRRKQILKTIEEWGRARNKRLLLKITDRLSWTEYLNTLSRTHVCLNVRGAGFDTYRYWEIPYTGSLLVSEWPIIEIPNNFQDRRHAFFFDQADLRPTLDEIFDDPQRMSRVAAEGRAHLLAHHTSVARARTLIQSWLGTAAAGEMLAETP